VTTLVGGGEQEQCNVVVYPGGPTAMSPFHMPLDGVTDAGVRYFGALLDDDTLVPGSGPRLGKIDFETWFSRSGAKK